MSQITDDEARQLLEAVGWAVWQNSSEWINTTWQHDEVPPKALGGGETEEWGLREALKHPATTAMLLEFILPQEPTLPEMIRQAALKVLSND